MVAIAANGYVTCLKNHVTANTEGFIKIKAFYVTYGVSAHYPTTHPVVVGLLRKIKDPSRDFHHPSVDAARIDEFVKYYCDYPDPNRIDINTPECTGQVEKWYCIFIYLLNHQGIIENQNTDVLVPQFNTVLIHGMN